MSSTDQRRYEEKVDSLIAQMVSAEEAIFTKEKEILELKSQIVKLQTDIEVIPLLQAQVFIHPFIVQIHFGRLSQPHVK